MITGRKNLMQQSINISATPYYKKIIKSSAMVVDRALCGTLYISNFCIQAVLFLFSQTKTSYSTSALKHWSFLIRTYLFLFFALLGPDLENLKFSFTVLEKKLFKTFLLMKCCYNCKCQET